MNEIIFRLMLSALSLNLFYIVFRLLLNKTVSLQASRIYLNITMIFALTILFPWHRMIGNPAEIAFTIDLDTFPLLPVIDSPESGYFFNWKTILITAYAIPAGFLLMFFMYANIHLLFLLRKGEMVDYRHAKLIILDRETLPYSWFGMVVMSRRDYESAHVESIVGHETTHIRQFHFLDLILVEILIIVQWFNPAVWAYRSVLRNVHEYLADQGTLKSGQKIADYQHLLASLTGSITAGIVSNNIKHSTLKNRFIMMTKTNHGKGSNLRIMLAFIAALLTGFCIFITSCQTDANKTEVATPEKTIVSEVVNNIPTTVETEEAFVVVEEAPAFPGGDEARIKYFMENVKYPKEARDKGIQGTVYVNFVVEKDGSVTGVNLLRGIGGGCDEEAVRVIENMPKWIPGKQRGEVVRVQFNIPVKFVLR